MEMKEINRSVCPLINMVGEEGGWGDAEDAGETFNETMGFESLKDVFWEIECFEEKVMGINCYDLRKKHVR